jgi:hypothetical protein
LVVRRKSRGSHPERQGVFGSEIVIAADYSTEHDKLLALSPSGTLLAGSHQYADFVDVFDTRSGRRLVRRKGLQGVRGVELLTDKVLLVAAHGGCLRFGLPRGKRTVLAENGWQACIGLGPRGGLMALGVTAGINLYDAHQGQMIHQLRANFALQQFARRVWFSPDESHVAAELGNEADRQPDMVVVWDARTGKRKGVFDTEAFAVAFAEGSPRVAVAEGGSAISTYELGQGDEPAARIRLEPPWQNQGVCALQLRDGGRTLAVLLSSGAFLHIETMTGRILRDHGPPAGFNPWGLNFATSADWSTFAGPTRDGFMIWPGDRAEPDAAADGGA